ncbi:MULTISPECIES: hypothetical protein [Flavobacterium]|uniref:hypothetical protein n=1 Tax=Flavobacterium TaxID=237 RepID=UPI001183460E|nr:MULTISPECIES: hypothetical protein [Flavobacterium]MCR4029691.1 hypothetical protein [Flavobacterium panacis]
METLPTLFTKILQLLSTRYNGSFTLEELTSFINSISTISTATSDRISNERKEQVEILEALIQLNDAGYIFLNPVTDQSCITLKGLIKIDSKAYCN